MPSLNSFSIASVTATRARIRPAAYPPIPNAHNATNSRNSPDNNHSHGEESRQVGAVDTTESPIPDPKASSVKETPAAKIAPAIIARQSINGYSSRNGAALMSMQSEERQDGHDHDDKANQIDQSVHDTSLTDTKQ